MQIQVRQRLELIDETDSVDHEGAPVILPMREADAVMGETVAAFLARVKWRFDLPTICVINGECYGRAEWVTRPLSLNDNVEFRSRPLGGGSGGSTAKSIGAIVAMVALTAFAPGIGTAAAGALLFGGGAATGTLASIISAAVIGAGALAVSYFLRPKAGGKDKATDPLQNFGLQGNQAKPMQPIPVLNGRLKFAPEYAAPTYSEYFGDGMIDYCLFALTCGRMDIEKVFIGDSEIWDKTTGPNAAYPGITLEFIDPGNQVTLYPVNVVTAEELQGVELTTDWSAPFIPAPAGTSTIEVMIDLIWPGGAYHTGSKGNTIPANTGVELQTRAIDDAGAPIGDWIEPFSKVYTFAKQSQIRITERLNWPGGRWEYRMKRSNPPTADGNGTDSVTWTALRAKIDGPQSFPRVMTMAVKGVASKQLSGVSGGQLKVLGTRILPVWQGGQFVDQPTRSIAWAALDWWQNGDYSAGLNLADLDFATFLQLDALWTQLGHTFDYRFSEVQNLDEVLETILKTGRAYPAPVGDKLTIVRDQPRGLSRMLFTENDIVAGSLVLDYALSDEQWADGIVGEYVDERTWRIAEVSSAPDGVQLYKPARVKLEGVVDRKQATGMVRFMAAESQYRRISAGWTARMEGRLLKKGDLVKLSADEPETWGQSREVIEVRNGGFTLRLDPPPEWEPSGNHYIEIRRRDGRPWGPVKVTQGATPDIAQVDSADAAAVAASQGMPLGQAVSRKLTQEMPWVAFSPGSPRTFPVLITEGTPDQDGEHIELKGVLDAPEVYTTTEEGVPLLPMVPDLYGDSLPVIIGLVAQISQRQATLVLTAGWVPAKNAVSYEGAVSYDGGTTWIGAYRGGDTTFEALVGSSPSMRVRVRGINPASQAGAWYVVEVVAPELSIDGDLFKNLSVQIEALSAQLQRDIAAINDLGRGTLALGQQLTDDALADARLALALADDTLRGADRQLAEAVEQLAAQQATQAGSDYEERQLLKVANGRSFAAIQRETRLRVSADEVQAAITTTLAVRLDVAESGIVGNASAIQGLSTRVTSAEGTIIAQAQSITQLSSRIDANDFAISGTATAVQSLTTRVTLTEGNISSVSESLTALGSTVSTQGGQISANATAIDTVRTRAEVIDGRVTSEAQRTTALEATVSTQGGQIAGQATALDQLTARTTATEAGVTSVAQRTTVLEASVSSQDGRIGGNSQALQDLSARTTSAEGFIQSQAQQISNLSSTLTGQGGQIEAQAQATNTLSTRVTSTEGFIQSQAQQISSLSTTQGDHTAQITTLSASYDGVKVQFGVTGYLDGAQGGFVFTGVRQLDGSASFSLRISADVFVDGTITARKLATEALIVTSAQIGNLVVDNINVRDGAISGLVSSYSSNRDTQVTLTVRTGGNVSIIAARNGDLSQRFGQSGLNTGAIRVYRDGNLIGAIPANFTMDFDPRPNVNASYFRLGPTTYPLLDQPGAGMHTYRVEDDNNAGIGGVYISVQESK